MALGHDNTGKARQEKQEQNKPAWAEHQQKPEEKKTRKEAVKKAEESEKTSMVKVFMKTDYRDAAKTGEVYTIDSEKAEELIRLGRAEAYDSKKHAKAPKAN